MNNSLPKVLVQTWLFVATNPEPEFKEAQLVAIEKKR